jgi:hypothetical protein
MLFKKAFLLPVSLFLCMQANSSVWDATEEWNEEWEAKFSAWVHEEFNETFFTVGRFKNFATDCADAAYGARAIFAYDHKLPFKIKNSTGAGGYISNELDKYNKEPDGEKRLRSFLTDVFDITNTKSIAYNDTYPVKVNRQFVRAGGVWLRPTKAVHNFFNGIDNTQKPGHAEVIKEVKATGVVYMIGSTVPQAVRELKLTSSFIYPPQNRGNGLHFWRYPDSYGTPQDKLPGFSEEQISLGGESGKRTFRSYKEAVYSRLRFVAESPEEERGRLVHDFCQKMKGRIDAVNEGVDRKQAIGRRCMNEQEYDNYSTPGRDAQALVLLEEYLALEFPDAEKFKKKHVRKISDDFAICGNGLQIAPGKNISYDKAAELLFRGKMSSNPNDKLETRWGLSNKKDKCPKYE